MYDKSVQNQPITSEQWAKSRHFFSSNFAEIVSESKQQFVVQEFVVNEDFRKNRFSNNLWDWGQVKKIEFKNAHFFKQKRFIF